MMASEPADSVPQQQRASGGWSVLPEEEEALTLEEAADLAAVRTWQQSGLRVVTPVGATRDLDGPTEYCVDPIESCWERNGMLVVIGVAVCLCVVAGVVLLVVFSLTKTCYNCFG